MDIWREPARTCSMPCTSVMSENSCWACGCWQCKALGGRHKALLTGLLGRALP